MRTKDLLGILLLLVCTSSFISCENKDDGFRGFMHAATIKGDSINGFYCYMDRGGGFAISYDPWLAGIERGYFAFNYQEEDWKTTADNVKYIDHARVIPYSIYPVIHPISKEEAEKNRITDKDSCSIPPLLSVSYGYRGYLNLNTGLTIVNMTDLKKVNVKMNIVYDPEKLTSDTLRLQLCYNPRIPDKWTNTSFDYSDLSCDISSFASLTQWNDSVTIVVDAGEEEKHFTKISKNDFLMPDIK